MPSPKEKLEMYWPTSEINGAYKYICPLCLALTEDIVLHKEYHLKLLERLERLEAIELILARGKDVQNKS